MLLTSCVPDSALAGEQDLVCVKTVTGRTASCVSGIDAEAHLGHK